MRRSLSSLAIAVASISFWQPALSNDGDSSASSDNASIIHETAIEDYQREHWSFTPLTRPSIPKVKHSEWAQNEIDYFILSKLERKQLTPVDEASKLTLLRRLKFDLIGLPPTLEDLNEFTGDTSIQAYEKLVDRLLASPGYGERWAQYWLDLARFAETDGFEHDKVRPQAWRYRQWVIDALNDDMPYSQFLAYQLAGDQIENGQHRIATTFCTAGPDMPDINEQDLRRHDKLNEITATIGSSLLGLQIGCAQCHDHKYDPISQADFYRLRAVFESAVPILKRDKPLEFLSQQSEPQTAFVYYRGELSGRGPKVSPAPPRIAQDGNSEIHFDAEEPRRAFVDWLFDPDNPLTARVIVNRIWQFHFGKSLCGNPSDFGVVAAEPSHPELLDYLATELLTKNWSIKDLHRKILTSATYRQASFGAERDSAIQHKIASNVASDAENQYYSRFPRRRLDGESIRDALLMISGQLNRESGGASVFPPLPEELKQTLLKGQWNVSQDASDHFRRSIYIFARRNLRYPIFEAFDRPDAGASCPQRNNSTTAIQSLHLLNGDLATTAAIQLRDRILGLENIKDFREQADRLWLIAFSRLPNSGEQEVIDSLLNTSEGSNAEKLLSLCLAVLNANEFIYID